MSHFIIVLHVVAASLVVGVLFVQSLSVVFRLRLKNPEHVEGAKWVQYRMYKFIYYPILVVALSSGMYLAIQTGAFQAGKWLHVKLTFVLILIALGFVNGLQINKNVLPKKWALMVHIAIFLSSMVIIYYVKVKPY